MGRRGFSLLEIVVVIVLVGILAATALPRFVDLADDAEQSVIESTVATIRSARTLYFSKAMLAGIQYRSRGDVSFYSFVQCDGNPTLYKPPGGEDWRGNYVGLADLRRGVFADPDASACGIGGTDRIQFVTRSGRTVTISRSGEDIVWSASPAY